jgi:hypothetical protein
MRAVIAISAATLLAGCGMKEVARSPGFEQGWKDGCESGVYERNVEFAGTPLAGDRFQRDDKRFETDREYAAGWNEGRVSCSSGRPGTIRR